MLDDDTRRQIKDAAIEALSEMSTDMSDDRIRKVMGQLRAILRLCDCAGGFKPEITE